MKTRSKTAPPEFDYILLVLVTLLLGFGLVMLFSASYSIAYSWKNDPLYFFVKQLQWTILGIGAMLVLININYRTWRKWSIPIILVTMMTLLGLLAWGKIRYGAERHLFGGSVQPSEFAKLSIIIYISAWLAARGKELRKVSYGLVPFAVLLGLLVGLIIIQPDISTSLLITLTAVAMFFIAGADILQIGILAVMGGLTFAVIISQSHYAQVRVKSFVESLPDPINSPYFHIREAVQALVEGGFFGAGLADGIHKHPGGIPLVHSDSIFAVVGEELGLIGSLLVILLFFLFAVRGMRIALHSTDTFGTLLAFGITTWLVLQAFINIAVITATFPFTGLPLPFFSYGGSSMVVNLAAVGILLNISRGGESGFDPHAYFNHWRRNRRSRVSRPRSRRGPTNRRSRSFARNIRRKR